MSNAEAPPAGRSGSSALRWTAVRGASLTALLILLVAAWRGQLDAWMLAAAVAAVALAGLLTIDARRQSEQRANLSNGQGPRPGVADALLAQIPDPLILVDRRVVVLEANEAAHSLLPALRIGRPLSFALRSPTVLDAVETVLRTGQPLKAEYAERVPAERIFEVQVGPLKPGPQGLEVQPGVVLFFRDLSSAQRLERMRVDFVANASHELRTPLASLMGFIETLLGPARDDAAVRERFLGIMLGQAQRMTRLIDDLLSLSRIEMRAHVAPETPVELAPLVRQMIDSLAPLASERGVEIRLATPEAPLWVLGDRDELLRVVENLVENAVKYGESGGRVDVGLQRLPAQDGRGIRAGLSVRDYGPGIAPEHLPRLTERFYRVDVAHSREKGGTGLGLAIVKHIVNRHRGRLIMTSRPGEGAEFQVELPVFEGG